MSIETIRNEDNRRALVNGAPRGTIAWSEHLKAWEIYHRHWPGQGAERIAERGGFGIDELVAQLGHLPLTWKPSAGTRFVPGVEPADGIADLIRAALTGDEAVEAVARAMTKEADDGCFERVDEWEADKHRQEWYPDDRPGSDYEDCEYYRNLAHAAIDALIGTVLGGECG